VEPNYELCDEREREHPMLRDTLVLELGKTAEAILRRAFSEAEVRERYAEWLELGRTERDRGRQLIVAGIERAEVRLFARSEKDEFLLRVQHPNFRALVPMGYDADTEEFVGLVLAEFQGSMPLAIHFARSLTKSIEQGLEAPPQGSGAIN
jgi:hypothetical protein